MKNAEKEYYIGQDAAYDAFEAIAEQVNGNPAASLAGFLTSALLAVHAMAPDEAAADQMIKDCLGFVKEKGGEVTCH